jgi:hypothetical protein
VGGAMSGYYLMHRGWMDNPVLGGARDPFSRREAWIWLIEHACWQSKRVDIAGRTVELKRGQLSHSLRFLAKAWNWDEAKVRRFCVRLQQEKMIDAATDAGQTVITICNYDHYQVGSNSTDAAIDAVATQQRRSSDANKKEGKEGKKEDGVDSAGDEPRANADASNPAPKPAPAQQRGHVSPHAVSLIAAFDAARTEAFGPALARPWPNAMDGITAERWLAAGAADGLGPEMMVNLCSQVMQAVHRKLGAQKRQPPGSLAFHDSDISRALKLRATQLPEVPDNVQPITGRTPPRERRTYGSDGVTARRAILNALGLQPGLEAKRTATG